MNNYLLNLQVLFQRDPKLASLIESASLEGTEVIRNRMGRVSMRFCGKAIHSLYDPIGEARRFVSSLDFTRDLIFILGFGLGYHIKEILKRARDDAMIIIIEARSQILKRAMVELDLVDLLGDSRVRMIVEAKPFIIQRTLHDWVEDERLKGFLLVEHPPSIRLFPSFYEEVRGIVRDVVDSKLMGLQTRTLFEGLWTRNTILNLPYILKLPGIKLLFDRFQMVPAFIVGAGPSLEKNGRELARAKGRSLIISTDTALKPLLNLGVEPDIIVGCDAQDKTMGDFEGVDGGEGVLVATTTIYPEALKRYNGPKFIGQIARIRYNERGEETILIPSLNRWVEEITEPKGYLQAGGSVSTVAFDLARNLGCNPIIFVGHDLSFSGEKMYAEGVEHIKHYKYMKEYMRDYMEKVLGEKEGSPTFEEKYKEALEKGVVYQEFIKRRRLMRVKGIDGGEEILTSGALYTYLRWFEDAISKIPNRLFINSTEGGAAIRGTKVMPLREAIDGCCKVRVPVEETVSKAQASFSSPPFKIIPLLEEVADVLMELSSTHPPPPDLLEKVRFISLLEGRGDRFQEMCKEIGSLFNTALREIRGQ
jgi:hypothetical protein